MDELTIGDKIYISSKQAAKITGYAKDYVGQLCREGRVEARLVGRNWYVLESSIREHRFGAESKQEFSNTQVEEVAPAPVRTWEPPTYAAIEEETLLPPLTTPEKPPMAPETAEAVVLMQDAWKEWFAAREQTQSPVEEEVTPVASQVAAVEEEVEEEEQEPTEEVRASDMSSIYNVSEVSHLEEEGSQIPLTRVSHDRVEVQEEEIAPTYAPRHIPQAPRVVGSVIDLTNIHEERHEPVIRSERIVRRRTRRSMNMGLTIQALFLSVAGLAIVAAVIGSGALDSLSATQGSNESLRGAIFDTLRGETRINK